ncbi:MAG: endolytic transglycosylase MltG [Proteobacteria bacterium]|nr:endolytic transglycosylase MltG [Pseudomonadota bacterium]
MNLPSKQIDFSIQPGSGLRSAARQIEQAGVDMPAWKFALLGRVMGKATSIKAGSYEITRGVTPWQLLAQVTQGDFSQSEIAFIEGWTFSQMRAVLDASPELKHDSTGLSNEQIMASIGAPLQHPEGWFFPDTYLFAKGSSDLVVLKRSHAMMEKQLQAAWAQRSPRSSLKTPYEALILASIIRLRIGMLLQTDPTVIYGLGDEFKGNLKKEHLLRDGPFNTYTRGGLPPRPLAMAGMGSLLAAVNPAEGDELYFVARGDGSSQFSRTLAEHNRAVQKYQLSGKR